MAQLGHVPTVSDAFERGDFRFEVVDMNGGRIDRVLVSPVAHASNAGERARSGTDPRAGHPRSDGTVDIGGRGI
jgi:hypothetical protein